MKSIHYLKTHIHKYHDIIIQKEYPSKKNTVAYVTYNHKPRIFKWYPPGFTRNMQTEYTILTKLKGKLDTPIILTKDTTNTLLIMNYLTGNNFCDYLNDPNIPHHNKQQHLEKLALWYAHFHQFFKNTDHYTIHGDAHIRNFLVSTKIHGLDFEETRPGKPVEDIARICASILTTNPMFTQEKYELCKQFISNYESVTPWKITHPLDELAYALIEKIPYRPTDEQLLKKHAHSIKNNKSPFN